MQRWYLTPALATAALLAAIVAPRLVSSFEPEAPAATPPVPPVPEVPPLPPAPAPHQVGHLSVSAGLDQTALLAGQPSDRYLTIGISAPSDIGVIERTPVDVAVVMDVSGSMQGKHKISYARIAAHQVVERLADDDRFALVTFSDYAESLISSGPIAYGRDRAFRIIDGIRASGNTNLYQGLAQAVYELGRDGDPGGRIIILSDGIATAGVTDRDAIGSYAEQIAKQGIVVSTVGLGLDIDEDLLARVAIAGGGAYDPVDDPSELASVFERDVEQHIKAVGRDVKVDVSLPPGVDLVEAIGWRTEPIPGGFRVSLGDIGAGAAKKIVARVRVRPADAQGAQPVAVVAASWYDLVDAADAHATSVATATVTHEVAEVDASFDPYNAVPAAQAIAGAYLDQAARAYEDGDVATATRYANEGSEVLRLAAKPTSPDAPAPPPTMAIELQQSANGLDERVDFWNNNDPKSTAGRRQVVHDKKAALDNEL
jgi:Ca-activated chloride channel family protein